MLNRIFVVDSVTLTSTGTAVSSYVPWDQSTRKLPTQVVVKATGQGAYVRLSNDASAATNADVLVQGGDHVVLSVQGRRWVSVLSDGASSTVNVGALSTGVSGSAASLDLAFVDAGVLDPRVTFTRASTATYFDSAGVLTSAAINESRRDFDPATLAVRGLLIEEARTNLMLYSEQFDNAWWTKSAATVTANATTSPDGTVDAEKLIATAVSANHYIISGNATISAGATVTASVFVKAAEYNTIRVAAYNTAITSGFRVDANLSTVTGTTGTLGTGSTIGSSVTNVGGGWYRITVTGVIDAGSTTIQMWVQLLDAGVTPFLGNGTSGIFVFGAQLEAGAFPTSYIPTTTTALTRSADVASVNTLSPWFNATAGTIYAEGVTNRPYTSATGGQMAQISDGTANNRMWVAQGNTTANTSTNSVVTTGATLVAELQYGPAPSSNLLNKSAFAYAANDFAGCANGGTVQTDPSGAVPTVTTLYLGISASLSSASNWNGYLRRIVYYPRRLSNAELQSITS